MTAEHYHALHSWMDAHPTAKRCVVALDRWLPLIPFVCYPVLLCLLNVRLFRLLGSQRQAALDLTAVIARTVFVPGLTFWGGTILRDRLNCWVSVKQFSKNDTATACQDWLRSTRLGRGSIKSHVRTVKVLGMGLFAFQERIHLWKGVTH